MMQRGEKILLWQGEAPYSDFSREQAQPSLTAFPVDGARGAVIICPGGGYATKAAHEGAPIARMLNSAGIAAFVLDYRVKPCHHEAPLTDAKRAIRVVKAMNYQYVGILGFSAGGHLCCSAATLYDAGDAAATDPIERFSSRPDVFIPCYAVVTMGKYTHGGSRNHLLGDYAKDTAVVKRFSAEENITSDTPPAFIWHTSEDALVPVQNSLLLASALAEKSVPFEMHIYPQGAHGLGLGAENSAVSHWGDACCRWLLQKGFGS